MKRTARIVIAVAAIGLLQMVSAPSFAGTPTCSEEMGIANHGQHIVGDYVTGTGNAELGWPPGGQVGQTIAGSGAAMPGAPAAKGHMLVGIAPGASFCTDSNNDGMHL